MPTVTVDHPIEQLVAEAQCYRVSGMAEFRRVVDRLRARADSYEAFLNALPQPLPIELDEVLYHLALRQPNP